MTKKLLSCTHTGLVQSRYGPRLPCPRLQHPTLKYIPPPPKPFIDETENDENIIFIAVEEMPEPIGGLTSILERLNYPEMAKRAGIEGRVTVKALVDKSGNVESVELVKGIGMGCDDEAMRVIKETKFTPGRQRGKAVKVYVNIPIRFELK